MSEYRSEILICGGGVVGLTTAYVLAQRGVRVTVADVSDGGAMQAAVARTEAAFGALHVLVSNAAIRYLSPIADADPARWDALLAVNV